MSYQEIDTEKFSNLVKEYLNCNNHAYRNGILFTSKKYASEYSSGNLEMNTSINYASEVSMHIVLVIILVITVLLIWKSYSKTVYWFNRDTCPHCVNMKYEWTKFELRCWGSMLKPVRIDITDPANKEIVDIFNIQSVPAIIKIEPDTVVKYKGDRTWDEIYKWASTEN